MKNLTVLLCFILLACSPSYAQNVKKLESINVILKELTPYFSKAELTESGQLNLTATEKYMLQNLDEKKLIVEKITSKWQEQRILIHQDSKWELWGWETKTKNTLHLDAWDLNRPKLAHIPVTYARPHPWFIYVGGQLGYDSEGNINLALNTRLGFFLLLNRWDLATTLSTGVTGNPKYGPAENWQNLGLMSRVHFPIKKYHISPNIGAEISYTASAEAEAIVSKSIVLGFTWFTGIGSLDIGIKIGNTTTGIGGYTLSPPPRRK